MSLDDRVDPVSLSLSRRDASWELEPGAFQDMYEDVDDDADAVTEDARSPPEELPLPLPPDTNNENWNPDEHAAPLQASPLTGQTDIRHYLTSPSPSATKAIAKLASPSVTATVAQQPQRQKLASRKRACQTDLPTGPAKRRRQSKDTVVKSAPLVQRQCSLCTKDVVCFGMPRKHSSGASSMLQEVCCVAVAWWALWLMVFGCWAFR